jgi:uncharacterized circularly permuted ATP-grasp superfamily protein
MIALDRRDRWAGPPYDEAFDDSGRPRPAYVALARRLRWDPLHPPGAVVQRLRGQPLGDDHRMLPVPLALDDAEYRSEIQAGIAQRARALQMFFADVVLDEGRYLHSGTELTRSLLDEILASEGTSLNELRHWWSGHNPSDIRFVYGPDLAREPSGRWVVLEDNVGCVGGCADSFYVFEAYQRATGLPAGPCSRPDLAFAVSRWLESLGVAPHEPGVLALLSDGDYLDVYLPTRYEEDDRRIRLVQQLGVQIVDDDDFARLCEGGVPLKAIVNIGVPSSRTWSLTLNVAFGQHKVPILNAPGTSVLGNKALLPFVSEMVEFYCREDAILQVPPTVLLRDGLLPTDHDGWVVKAAAGCQGTGVFILRAQAPDSLDAVRASIRTSWPTEAAVAQRYIELSRLWTARPSGAHTYRVEVRALAYVLGWQDVFAGEQSLGKLVSSSTPGELNNVARGGSYVPVIRQIVAEHNEN